MNDNLKKLNVLILFGGRSEEHEVSLTSASYVLEAIDKYRFNPLPVLITKTGDWLYLKDFEILIKSRKKLIKEDFYKSNKESFIPIILDYIQDKSIKDRLSFGQNINLKIDLVFPILHGPFGEDGTIQGFCKLADLPCVGSDIVGSVLCIDKCLTKDLLKFHGIKVIDYKYFTYFEFQKHKEKILEDIKNNFNLPIFVKPSSSGSSIGITKLKEWKKLEESIKLALKYSPKVLIEKGINARELECGVIGNEEPKVANSIGEIIPGREFYDYEAKYFEDKSKTELNTISQDIKDRIINIAIKVYKILHCSGYARIDFLLDKDTNIIYVNEVNTIPGFTAISMFPMIWKSVGLEYSKLITLLIELSIEKYNKEKEFNNNF